MFKSVFFQFSSPTMSNSPTRQGDEFQFATVAADWQEFDKKSRHWVWHVIRTGLSCLHRCSRSANMEIEWNQMKLRNWRATWMSSKLSMRTLHMFKFRLIAYVTCNPKQEPICQINVARKRMHPSGISLALVQGMSHERLEFLPNIDPKEEGYPHVATWLPWIPISLQVFPKNNSISNAIATISLAQIRIFRVQGTLHASHPTISRTEFLGVAWQLVEYRCWPTRGKGDMNMVNMDMNCWPIWIFRSEMIRATPSPSASLRSDLLRVTVMWAFRVPSRQVLILGSYKML